jgi:hypothetical protein
MRLAAIEMIKASDDVGFRRASLLRLASDPVDFVRAAAIEDRGG